MELDEKFRQLHVEQILQSIGFIDALTGSTVLLTDRFGVRRTCLRGKV